MRRLANPNHQHYLKGVPAKAWQSSSPRWLVGNTSLGVAGSPALAGHDTEEFNEARNGGSEVVERSRLTGADFASRNAGCGDRLASLHPGYCRRGHFWTYI